MKRLSLFSVAALGLLAMSCSNQEIPAPVADGEGITFTVGVPADMKTRTFDDGKHAQTLTWAIFEQGKDDAVLTSRTQGAPVATYDNYNFTITFNLVKGKTYDFVFWADNGNSIYTISDDFKTMNCNYSNVYLSDKNTDAFYNVVTGIKVTGASQQSTILRRPFAQVNLGCFTADIEAAKKVGIEVNTVELSVKGAYSQLDLFSGVASEPVEGGLKFIAAGLANEATDGAFPTVVEGKPIKYFSMAYILTGTELLDGKDVQKAQQELMDATFTLNLNDNSTSEVPVPGMPIQRNYRTNIYGNLLTSPMDWTITVSPDFEEPDYVVEVKDALELENALNNGGNIVLANNIIVESGISAKINATIDLNGKTLTLGESEIASYGVNVDGQDVELVIKGNGTIAATDNVIVLASKNGAKLTIENGTFEGGNYSKGDGACECIYLMGDGLITINGGEFKSLNPRAKSKIKNPECPDYGWFYVLNKQNNVRGNIVVNGGTFYGYNPAWGDDADTEAVSFVSEGKTVTETTVEGYDYPVYVVK